MAADSEELRMYITSIKRLDPYVKEILSTSTHVALYKFNILNGAWEKTDTEGALFVYSRNGEPYHSIMVMNRLNTNNVIEPIVKDFDYQMQEPFLLYRNSKSKIFGIWFYNKSECIQISKLIKDIMEGDGGVKDKSSVEKSKKQNDTDIFCLLTKAQEEFHKTPTKQEPTPAAFSTPRVMENTKSVQDFFAKAGTKTTQKPITSMGDGENVLQRLMANPAHTVEHIEKQQRSITPHEQVPFKQKPNADRRSVPILFPTNNTAADKNLMENGNCFMGMPPSNHTLPGSSFPQLFLSQSQQQTAEEPRDVSGTSPFAQFLDHKPLLMTPMMFTAPTPEKVLTPHPTENYQEGIDLLTEKQLSQAMIYLIKTNPNFTKQIHEAYVHSIMEKVNPSTSNSLI